MQQHALNFSARELWWPWLTFLCPVRRTLGWSRRPLTRRSAVDLNRISLLEVTSATCRLLPIQVESRVGLLTRLYLVVMRSVLPLSVVYVRLWKVSRNMET